MKNPPSRPAFGYAYQPTYTDKKTGEKKPQAVWWIQYSTGHGKPPKRKQPLN